MEALNDYETRQIVRGDLSDALNYYKSRTGCTMAVARQAVYAEYRRINNLPEPTQKFVGYHEDSELPVKRGDSVTIRKGTIVKRRGGSQPAGRTYKVKIDHILNGVNRHRNYRDEPVGVQNPSIRWGGSDGWCEVDINDIPEAHA